MTCLRACPVSELWQGEMRRFELGDRPVLLVNEGGHLAAFADRCAHQAVPLSEGRLQRGVLTCRAHEWQYDARTGAGINPTSVQLTRYPLEIRDGDIWVDVDDAR